MSTSPNPNPHHFYCNARVEKIMPCEENYCSDCGAARTSFEKSVLIVPKCLYCAGPVKCHVGPKSSRKETEAT